MPEIGHRPLGLDGDPELILRLSIREEADGQDHGMSSMAYKKIGNKVLKGKKH
jgi:hypothetical protein